MGAMGPTTAARPRAVRILATLGPASADLSVIGAMIAAGMDAVRINCSHGEPRGRAAASRAARDAATRLGAPLAVLFDIAGPKLRVHNVAAEGMDLAAGDRVKLVGPGRVDVRPGETVLALTFEPAALVCRRGDRVLLDDGRIAGRVVERRADDVVVEVERGDVLGARKAVCFPDSRLRLPALGRRDRADLRRAAAAGADAVALSFVERAADVLAARRLLPPATAVVAKIERAAAVENLEELLDVADGVMVARGDLGVELPLDLLPLVQKDIIDAANQRDVPVICATEMLESMTVAHRPTRAEATDVANAVLDGADAVMLSGETATGRDPVAAVAVMAAIVASTEASRRFAHCHPQRAAIHPRRRHPWFLAPSDGAAVRASA